MGKLRIVSLVLLLMIISAVPAYAGGFRINGVEVKGNYIIANSSAEVSLSNITVGGYVYRANEKGELVRIVSGNKEADDAVRNILSQIIKPGMAETEKLKAVYDHMASYNWRAVNADVSGGYTDEKMAELALYLVHSGRGNCDHYASLEILLIRGLGYKAEPMVGQRKLSEEGQFSAYTWAKVYVDGKACHFDPGYAFLLTDEEVKATHRW